jgi:hypothetical protein
MLIECETDSLAGKVDRKAIRRLEKYRKFKFDPVFLEHLPQIHGGIPTRPFFTSAGGNTCRVGRFLTVLDRKSRLEPPAEPSWEDRTSDVRIVRSIRTLIDQEGPSCRRLFGGERLIPFAALYRGENHPDGMSLTEGDCDLVCFDNARHPPSIVLWDPLESHREYVRWESGSLDEDVDYASFVEPVANTFSEFAAMLATSPRQPT